MAFRMDRAKAVFLALVFLVALVGLIVWIHVLNRRVDELTTQVQGLSGRLDKVEGRSSFPRPSGAEGPASSDRGGPGPVIKRRRGEGGPPSLMAPPVPGDQRPKPPPLDKPPGEQQRPPINPPQKPGG